jgi:hypothetical protein
VREIITELIEEIDSAIIVLNKIARLAKKLEEIKEKVNQILLNPTYHNTTMGW